jgi:hypothetical protein
MIFHTVDEIFASIDKTRDKLIRTVVSLNNDQCNFRFSEEKWSVANIVEHLAKTEENLIRLIGKLLSHAEAEGKASDGKIEPPVSFAEIAEKARGLKLEAPDAIKPGGAATIAESAAKLERSRAALHEMRPRLKAVDLSNASFPHPYFGAMNGYYWLAFVGLHELHHLKQVADVLSIHEQKQNS